MNRYYYSKDGSEVQGPVGTNDLLQMYLANILGDATQVCQEGSDVWQPLSDVVPTSESTKVRHPNIATEPQRPVRQISAAKLAIAGITICLVIGISVFFRVSHVPTAVSKESEKPSTVSTHVDVEVFIVTKGSENVKLGLVDVEAYPKQSVTAALRPFLADRKKQEERLSQKAEQERKDFDKKLEDSSKRESDAEQLLNQTKAVREAALTTLRGSLMAANHSGSEYIEQQRVKLDLPVDWYIGDSDDSDPKIKTLKDLSKKLDLDSLIYGIDGLPDEKSLKPWFTKWRDLLGREVWTGLPTQRDSLLKVMSQAEAADLAQQKAQTEYDSADHIHQELLDNSVSPSGEMLTHILANTELFSQLPQSAVSEKTDADGKCRLELPNRGQWIVTATAQRMVGDKVEVYWWMVEVPEEKQSEKTPILLSNDNLLTDGEVPTFLSF